MENYNSKIKMKAKRSAICDSIFHFNLSFLFFIFAFLFIAVSYLQFPEIASAQVTIDQLTMDKAYNDFVVGPGKMEVALNPGDTATVNVSIANRLGVDKIFTLDVEDFTGSTDPNQTVILLGDDRGPYSLRDYLYPATTSIMIANGMRATIPVQISIPADAQPGGLYGSVVVSNLNKPDSNGGENGAVSSTPIITRIGALFFVRVKGNADESGQLESITIACNHWLLWDSLGMAFDILYRG